MNTTKKLNTKAYIKINKLSVADVYLIDNELGRNTWDLRCKSKIPLTEENIELFGQLLDENREDLNEALAKGLPF